MTGSTSLSGRIAVVTGAASGIGEAAARALAESGATVALIARRKERLDALAANIRQSGGKALPLAVDVTDKAALADAARVVRAELGPVDLVVNNAGVMYASPVTDHRVTDFERMIDLNITGAMRVIDAFVDSLVAAAAEGRKADLINVSSIGAHGIFPNFAVYCATKAALTHLSKNLRAELGPKHVRVSTLEPGLVETELQGHVQDPGAKTWLDSVRTSLKWLSARDVAEVIAFTAALPRHVNLQQISVMPTEQV